MRGFLRELAPEAGSIFVPSVGMQFHPSLVFVSYKLYFFNIAGFCHSLHLVPFNLLGVGRSSRTAVEHPHHERNEQKIDPAEIDGYDFLSGLVALFLGCHINSRLNSLFFLRLPKGPQSCRRPCMLSGIRAPRCHHSQE